MQNGLVGSLLIGVYTKVATCLGLTIMKLISLGVGVAHGDSRYEIGVILFNDSVEEFSAQVEASIAQLILKNVKVLSVTIRGNGGFGTMGLQSGD